MAKKIRKIKVAAKKIKLDGSVEMEELLENDVKAAKKEADPENSNEIIAKNELLEEEDEKSGEKPVAKKGDKKSK